MATRYYIDLESAQYGGNFKQFELMIEDADGEFVTHSDYAALLARAEAAEKERDSLRAERDRMREALRMIEHKGEAHEWSSESLVCVARAALGGGE